MIPKNKPIFFSIITAFLLIISSRVLANNKTDFLKALQENKIEDVRKLLSEGFDLKTVNKETDRKDFKPIEFPSPILGELLLDNGLDPDIFLKLVLRKNCNRVDFLDYFHHKSVVTLVTQRNELVQLALKKGANSNHLLQIATTQYVPTKNYGYYVILTKQEELIKLALDYNADFATVKIDPIGPSILPSPAVADVMFANPSNHLDPSLFLLLVLKSYLSDFDKEGLLKTQYILAEKAIQKGADLKKLPKGMFYNKPPAIEVYRLLLKNGLAPDEFLELISSAIFDKYENDESKTAWKNFLDFLVQEGANLEQFKNQYPETDDPFDITYLHQGILLYKLGNMLASSSLLDTDNQQFLLKDKTFLVRNIKEGIGHCMGLTTLWLYSKWAQFIQSSQSLNYNYAWFESTKKFTVIWDNARNLTVTESKNLLNFGQLIDFFQSPNDYIKGASQGDIEKNLTFSKLSTNNIPLKIKYTIAAPLTRTQLSDLLKKMVHYDEWVYVISPTHATGLFKHNNIYYFYDPNDIKGEYKNTSLTKIADHIFNIHKELETYLIEYDEAFPKKENFLPRKEDMVSLSFIVVGDPNIYPHSYPDQKEFLTGLKLPSNNIALDDSINLAISFGCIKSLKFFLDYGIDPASQTHGPLIIGAACFSDESRRNKMVEELLKRNADPNSPITIDPKIIDTAPKDIAIMIERDVLPDNGKTALQIAAERGYLGTIELLLSDPRTNIDQENIINGKTALMYAVENNQIKAVGLLLSKGADKNRKDLNGKTALMLMHDAGIIDKISEQLLH